MLRIIPQANAPAAKQYYSHADYYAADLAEPAVWGGKGAALLGLSGPVTVAQFHALCDNRDPRDGSPLTPRTRTGRTVLYDFNVHVPKSLSVLLEHTRDPRLLQAVTAAADATMRELEDDALTRVRQGGQDADRRTGNLVWAMIPHRTAPPARPATTVCPTRTPTCT
jgi:conjugative relaxase-like TrwC/TraI family protein